jgi:hypothetical protein
MKAKAKDTRISKAACVALTIAVASMYVLLAAGPALAEDSIGPVGPVIESAQGLQIQDLQVQQGVDWGALLELEIASGEDEAQAGPFPDGGGEGVPAVPEFPEEIPDAGDSQIVTQTTVPDDGQDGSETPQQSDEPTDTPETSDEPTDTPEVPDDEPSLPFTGGNAAGFLVAGLGLCLAGVGATGVSRKNRS